jgi:hypothetical protein
MSQVLLALQAGLQVLVAAVILGAGLPVLFSLGMRSLAYGTGGAAEVDVNAKPHPLGRAMATLCFGVVILAIVLGIAWIVGTGMGYVLSFDHILPVFRKK